MKEPVNTIYRGIDKNLNKFDPGVEWWTLNEQDAKNYGTDDEGNLIILTAEVDFNKYKTLEINAKTITDVYISDILHKAVGVELIEKLPEKIIFKEKNSSKIIELKNSIEELQPFFHDKLKENDYDIFHYTFYIQSKLIDEIAVLKDNILNYEAPEWYNKHWSTKS